MTVAVWDGTTLACDRGASDGPTIWEVNKMLYYGNYVIVGVGPVADVGRLIDWYLTGANPDHFPYSASAMLLVVKDGERKLYQYDHSATPRIYEDTKVAFGSGKDFAFGGLAAGATAEQAVQIACRFSTSCGHGVDKYDPMG